MNDFDLAHEDSATELEFAGLGFDSLAIRTGHQRTAEGEHSEPMFLTSSFVYSSAADAAAAFGGQKTNANIYSRFTNPTVRTIEQRFGDARRWRTLCGDCLRHGGDFVNRAGVFGGG